MRLSDFDYNLPKELIAQYPLPRRDECRLLVVDRAAGSVKHCSFRDIAAYLSAGDLLVLNDTKVLPSRLKGRRATGGAVEVMLLKHRDGARFEAMISPGRVKLNERIVFSGGGAGGLTGIITGRDEVTFEADDPAQVYACGRMPLPPYIKRDAQEIDVSGYQTVYARCDGAVAAPTAGLHFTREFLDDLSARGVSLAYVTLHVGTGTFKPVKSEDITLHTMDEEYFSVPPQTRELLRQASPRARVIAVGTTGVRSLESYAAGPSEGNTKLFIYPGYRFKLVDGMITNFHLPRTTLFMLVCAFAGTELIQRAYAEAVKEKYRFYSYGDAMLII